MNSAGAVDVATTEVGTAGGACAGRVEAVAVGDATLPSPPLSSQRTTAAAATDAAGSGGIGAGRVGVVSAPNAAVAAVVSRDSLSKRTQVRSLACVSHILSLCPSVCPASVFLSRQHVARIVLGVAYEKSHFHPTPKARTLPLGVLFEEAESSPLVIFLAGSCHWTPSCLASHSQRQSHCFPPLRK